MMTRPRLSGAKPDSTKACVPIVRNAERGVRSEEHTSELQSQSNLVCRLLLEKKKNIPSIITCGHSITHVTPCTKTPHHFYAPTYQERPQPRRAHHHDQTIAPSTRLQ